MTNWHSKTRFSSMGEGSKGSADSPPLWVPQAKPLETFFVLCSNILKQPAYGMLLGLIWAVVMSEDFFFFFFFLI